MQKLTNQQIKDIIAELEKSGKRVGLKDISYVFLSRIYDDRVQAYKVIFGKNTEGFQAYDSSDIVAQIDAAIRGLNLDVVGDESISFDELKRGLVEDMQSLIALRDQVDEDGKPVLEPKEMSTVVARIADIRVKLTSKFGATEKTAEQRVVVHQKYDSICPYCRHEIATGK